MSVYPDHVENHPQTPAQIEVTGFQTRWEIEGALGGEAEARQISRKSRDEIGAIPHSGKTDKTLDVG